ncbi:MAG: hypothetical protein WDN49_23275 [Acetobacteraceae bacterium]
MLALVKLAPEPWPKVASAVSVTIRVSPGAPGAAVPSVAVCALSAASDAARVTTGFGAGWNPEFESS